MGLILSNIWVRLALIITQSSVEINWGDIEGQKEDCIIQILCYSSKQETNQGVDRF
jgi:hypothetical protein